MLNNKKVQVIVDIAKINAERLTQTIADLKDLGVWDEHKNCVVYDSDNKEMEQKIKAIFDKYLLNK